MKRLMTMLLAAIMLLSLAACGTDDQTKQDKKQAETDKKIETEDNTTGKKKPDGITYDFENPEEDRENSPGYVYFVQSIPTEETGMTEILKKPVTDDYYDIIANEIKTYPLFSRSEILQEKINQDTQLIDDDGNVINDETESEDMLIYVQDEPNVNEIAVAVYKSVGYNYITYGSMQQVEDITTYADELDLDTIPQMAKNICGITVTKEDLTALLEKIKEMKAELPDEAIYMASIMDPESFDAIQVALLPYEGPDTIGITTSRYIETAA